MHCFLFNFNVLGFLKEKTCILITHQLQYLTKVDQIILMQNVSRYCLLVTSELILFRSYQLQLS